ncbi:MAG: phosphogluconate dehydrogenase (NAD(+)-dependent, decarboxylating) [Gaiellaceae bacterium]
MQLGMIGLGRMGHGMTERLSEHGHDMKTYDPNVAERTSASLAELKQQLEAPRAFWMMIPAGKITEDTFKQLLEIADEGDIIVDGGNSNFRDSKRRYVEAKQKGIHFIDAGVSGGIWGLEVGFCLMVGGDDEPVQRLEPIFEALAPEAGYAHVGPSGAGHFVKMVHNGIEYGLMAAYAEGLNILAGANVGAAKHDVDAETSPLERPDLYQYDFDLAEVTEVWRRGSVVASWLLDLTAQAFLQSPNLDDFGGRVSDSGEGRWTSIAAIDVTAPAPVLTTALYARFSSRGDDDYANRILAAMRHEFGGHVEKPAAGEGGGAAK